MILALVGTGIGFIHLVQELYESLQITLSEAVDVGLQVSMAEKCVNEWSILLVRGVQILQPLSDIRD